MAHEIKWSQSCLPGTNTSLSASRVATSLGTEAWQHFQVSKGGFYLKPSKPSRDASHATGKRRFHMLMTSVDII